MSPAIMPTMNDQLADPTNHVAGDQPTTNDGRDQPAADQATTPALLTLEEAAAELGITVNAIRQRIKRGTLLGVKTDTGWLVDPDHRPATERPPTRATGQPTNHTTTSTDQQPTIDLAPLAEVIRDQNRRLEELAAAAAMWQTRAAHLENELKQLPAGETASTGTRQEVAGSPQTSGSVLQVLRTWLRRLLSS